jgi:SNF2 family DNA or RNA helicase
MGKEMTMKIEQHFIYFKADQKTALSLGASWVESRKEWRVPSTIGALQELRNTFPLDLGIEHALQTKRVTRNEYLKMKSTINPRFKLDERLRPYQKQDVSYLTQLPNALIANEQRTGKTPTVLALVKELDLKNIIIVCPSKVINQWAKEVETWVEGSKVFAIKGTPKQREKIYKDFHGTSNSKKSQESQKDILSIQNEKFLQYTNKVQELTFSANDKTTSNFLVISYETLRNDIQLVTSVVTNLEKSLVKNTSLDGLICDEIHRLNNHRSKQAKAVYSLGRKAKHRYGLTGTPTQNDAHSIFGILHFLYPQKFPSYWQFVERYFKVWESPWGSKEIGKPKRQEELEEILSVISTNRKRADVMKWLPEKQYLNIELDADTKQLKAYNDVMETYEYMEDGELLVDAQGDLPKLMRLRQICLHPELLNIKAKSPKEEYIFEWLEDNPNEPVIIFSNFTSYLNQLARKLNDKGYRGGMLTGQSMNPHMTISDFQSGKIDILLANIVSAGEGLTLDRGETIIFLDKHFNPTKNIQAEDRITPTTEERNHSCTIISLSIKDTIDEDINKLLDKKINITDVINNAGINGLRRILDEGN